jgi:hypothetical protein
MEKTIKHSGTSGQGQSEAERRVKAAAPEMLKALEAIVAFADASDGQLDRMAWDNARAAIAKAQGG